jgi:hypothetical protein
MEEGTRMQGAVATSVRTGQGAICFSKSNLFCCIHGHRTILTHDRQCVSTSRSEVMETVLL